MSINPIVHRVFKWLCRINIALFYDILRVDNTLEKVGNKTRHASKFFVQFNTQQSMKTFNSEHSVKVVLYRETCIICFFISITRLILKKYSPLGILVYIKYRVFS